MSLFKARDWWRVQCGSSEEFDGGCLCIGNVDGEPSGAGTSVQLYISCCMNHSSFAMQHLILLDHLANMFPSTTFMLLLQSRSSRAVYKGTSEFMRRDSEITSPRIFCSRSSSTKLFCRSRWEGFQGKTGRGSWLIFVL